MKQLMRHPFVAYGILGLIIMGPMLSPGYIFTLDMAWGPKLQLPNEITASYPFYIFIKLLSYVIPSQMIQKLMLLSIIIVSGLGAHRLTTYFLKNRTSVQLGAYFAGLLYIVNPFTYVRFMDGHFAVLLGYAVLPFFTKSLFELLFDKKFTFGHAARTALYACVCIVFSVHALGLIAIVCIVAVGVFALRHRRTPQVLISGTKYLGLIALLLVAFNSYWLMPTLMGNTPREALIQNFDMRHFLSFRTDGATDLGVLGNIVTMHGYWGDREGRYTLPQSINPVWPIFFIAIFLLAMYGLYRTRRNIPSLTLTVSACIAAVLAIGIAATPFNHINIWLIETLPFFRGFREPQKFVGVLAMFYAVLGGVGLAYFRTSSFLSKLKSDHLTWLIGPILILPLLYTPTFLGGFAGQLQSRDYPDDWASANTQYISKSSGTTLFLPWHHYMYFDFAGRVITHPAPVYFDGNIMAGDNVEIGLIRRQTNNPNSQLIEQALAEKDPDAFIRALNTLHIEYVVLSKDADWQNYTYLDDMPLEHIKDTETLKIYRNSLPGQQLVHPQVQ